MTIVVKSKGSFKKTEDFLERMKKSDIFNALDTYGAEGVAALRNATPTETGLTASSWTYKVTRTFGKYKLSFHNTNMRDGIPVAILIQYGHATGTGGHVVGRDYINPVIRPLFDKIANEVWKAVKF